MKLIKLGLLLAGLICGALLAGLVYEPIPSPLDVLMGIAIVYLFPIAVSISVSRAFPKWRYLAAPAILFVVLAAGVFGQYLSYSWEWWSLDYSDYGSDDQPGASTLYVRFWVSLFTAVILGLIVGFAGPLTGRKSPKNAPRNRYSQNRPAESHQ